MRHSLKADETHREDSHDLNDVEQAAVADIYAVLQRQMRAVTNARGRTEAEIATSIETILATNSDDLLRAITTLLTNSTQVGLDFVVESLMGLSASVDWRLADAAASEFVQGYAFDLVTGINNTTAARLRGVMRSWIEKGGDMDDLTNSIRPIFANEPATARIEAIFNVDRARMIGETEATRAYAEGKVIGYTSSGLADYPPEKKPPDDSHVRCRCDITLQKMEDGSWHWVWLTANDEHVCDICGPLHEQSVGLAKAAATA